MTKGGQVCAVRWCKNKQIQRNVSFFRFPRETERAKLWAIECGRDDLLEKIGLKLYNNYRICGIHFEEHMFLNDLKNRLQPHAVPKLFPLQKYSPRGVDHNYSRNPMNCVEKLTSNSITTQDSILRAALCKQANSRSRVSEHSALENTSSELVNGKVKTEVDLPTQDTLKESTCRICLENYEVETMMVSMFEVSLDDETVADLLNQYASIKVSRDDNYSHICQNCLDEFTKVHIFIRKCQEADDNVQHLLDKQRKEQESKDANAETTRQSSRESPEVPSDNRSNENQDSNPIGEGDEEFVNRNEGSSQHTNGEMSTETSKATDPESFIRLVAKVQGPEDKVLNIKLNKEILKSNYLSKPEKKVLRRIVNTVKGRHFDKKFPKISLCCNKIFLTMSKYKKHCKDAGHEFNCTICDKKFLSQWTLFSHQKIAHSKPTGPFICEYCSLVCTTLKSLTTHIRLHTGEKPYVCEVCGLRYISNEHLKQHSVKHKEVKDHVCEICGKGFWYRAQLRVHIMRIHDNCGISEYQCRHCKDKFPTKVSYKRHTRMEHIKLFASAGDASQGVYCTVCNKFMKFTPYIERILNSKEAYNQYISSNGSNWSCDFCGKVLSKHSTLMKHRRMHTEKSNFQCYICGRLFLQPSKLQAHMTTHTVKRFSCSLCDRKFHSKRQRDRHFHVHKDSSLFRCDTCHKNFTRYNNYQRHCTRVHQVENDGVNCIPQEIEDVAQGVSTELQE